MNSKEALEKLSYIPIYEEDEHNVITDINNCCVYKGDLYEIYENEVDTIEKDLEVLEEYRKIEKELGIELTVLFSALKYGIYYVEDNCQRVYDNVYLISNYINTEPHDKLSYSFITYHKKQILLFEEYGKTWFLVKKDLAKKESKMKILSNKEQNKLIEKIMELNSLIANSNADLKAFDLLGDIMSSVLDMRHTNKVKDALIEELTSKGAKK